MDATMQEMEERMENGLPTATPSMNGNFDAERAGAFAGRMIGIINDGMVALLLGIGNETGLLDTFATLPPSTSQQIADAAALNERYVREWLAALVVSRIVEYDPATERYWLPREHAASLTRAAGPDNLAQITQYVAVFGAIEQEIVECFRHGGGVPYSKVPRFQHLQAEETIPVVDATLIQRTLPAIPGLVDQLRQGIRVLEIGSGYGHLTNVMAENFPRSSFTAIDFSEEGVAHGREEAAHKGLRNAHFYVQDAHLLDANETYDFVCTFDVVHDLKKPATVLAAIHRALKPGGVYLMVDIAASSHLHENIDHPLAPSLYAISIMHCMTVSLSQGGDGLGTVWGEQTALRMLSEAGFSDISVTQHEGDFLNNYYMARKQ